MTTRRISFDGKGPPVAVTPSEKPRKGTTITGPIFVARWIRPHPPMCPFCRRPVWRHPKFTGMAACRYCPRLLVLRRGIGDSMVEKTGPMTFHCNILRPGMPGAPYEEANWYWHPYDDKCKACDPATRSFD